jgi:secondary thiamine-phosphate synthase enzyme
MKFVQKEFLLSSGNRNEMIDITRQVRDIVHESGISNGDVVVFCPHTTGAITINENADPSVQHDMLLTFEELMPHHRAGYRHAEGNSDAHCKSSLVGTSELILLHNKRLTLGTWQGVYFCEFDGPRHRKVVVQVRGE